MKIYSDPDSLHTIPSFIQKGNYSRVAILVDENTDKFCLPILRQVLSDSQIFLIESGEVNKNISTVGKIWSQMLAQKFDRKSLLINLGGGIICDMGGFAAATFKRGISFIHIPTTLLAMVDASIGSKTGVDFEHLKNAVGLFQNPEAIFIYPEFLKSLPEKDLKSGFAEVIKHALVADSEQWKSLCKFEKLPESWDGILKSSAEIKQNIVAQDPLEKGIRKALNFGHTIGHALESCALKKGGDSILLHGEAVALGMICESFISLNRKHITEEEFDEICNFIFKIFNNIRVPEINSADFNNALLQDKKNESGQILCTLLDGIGKVLIAQNISKEEALQSLQSLNQFART